MVNYLELSKRVDALILDNASITCENHGLKKRLEVALKENEGLTATVSDLVEKNEKLEAIINAYAEENEILYKERVELKHKINSLETVIESCEDELEELDNECNRLSDALGENESKVIHYVAVSLDVKYCIPLVSENPIEAGLELMSKCRAKGIPYGGFKVFEKSELL